MFDKLPDDWRQAIGAAISHQQIAALTSFVESERSNGAIIYPPSERIFAALVSTPLRDVRVVILGQDPYHGPGQAHGLSFSVPKGVKKPPSLRNIMKELQADIGLPEPDHGCLESWCSQGVLLLNSVLTVRDGAPASHADRGWEIVTDHIIRAVNDRPGHAVFILWGAYAQKKADFVDRNRHLVIATAHPSPFAARKGFFGSRPFSKANAFLKERGLPEIDWRLT